MLMCSFICEYLFNSQNRNAHTSTSNSNRTSLWNMNISFTSVRDQSMSGFAFLNQCQINLHNGPPLLGQSRTLFSSWNTNVTAEQRPLSDSSSSSDKFMLLTGFLAEQTSHNLMGLISNARRYEFNHACCLLWVWNSVHGEISVIECSKASIQGT